MYVKYHIIIHIILFDFQVISRKFRLKRGHSIHNGDRSKLINLLQSLTGRLVSFIEAISYYERDQKLSSCFLCITLLLPSIPKRGYLTNYESINKLTAEHLKVIFLGHKSQTHWTD